MRKFLLLLSALLFLGGCQHRGTPGLHETGTASDANVPTWSSTDPTTRQTGNMSNLPGQLDPALREPWQR